MHINMKWYYGFKVYQKKKKKKKNQAKNDKKAMCIHLLRGSNKSNVSAWQLSDSRKKQYTQILQMFKNENAIKYILRAAAAASITAKYNTGLQLDKRIQNGTNKIYETKISNIAYFFCILRPFGLRALAMSDHLIPSICHNSKYYSIIQSARSLIYKDVLWCSYAVVAQK